MKVDDYLFERVFFQSAHIAILDVALQEAKADMERVRAKVPELQDLCNEMIRKIDVAYNSIEKLKRGEEAGG